MKKTAVVANEAKPARKMPDMSGVPGELISIDAVPPGILFGGKRQSPYDKLLLQLQAQPDKLLRFGDAKAYASLHARAKKLSIGIEMGVSDNLLFVRMKEFHGERAAKRRADILVILKPGTSLPAPGIAAKLREMGDTADGGMVSVILEQMVRTGEVIKQEGGTWRRK